ncbi:unnamed protein product [Symbiodinium natans]|uniref:VWFA domain-containing protein n=1 Tax=Symbiodinium natans TaxID=878477 RepID=A0A812KDZ1_9DINO|nr:unnamed protein product [Symbiodinium natans]
MPHPKSRPFRKRECEARIEDRPEPCTASVRHEAVCPLCFVPLPSAGLLNHFSTAHHSTEPSIGRDRLLSGGSTIQLLDARTPPAAEARASGQERSEFSYSLPYELDVEFTLPRWLTADASNRILFLALDMNLVKQYKLSPLSVWKGASVAEQFQCIKPAQHIDAKQLQQRLHGIPVKPCVLSGGKARLLLLVVEQPKYLRKPEWSLLGMHSVALDRSPLQLRSAVQYAEMPFEDLAVYGQVTLETTAVPVTPEALHRVPLNIMCVLDSSSSMSPYLQHVQTAMCHMLQRLVPQDQLGVVTSTSVALELSLMDDEGKRQVTEALEAVQTEDDANDAHVTRGLALALQCLEMMERRAAPSSVSAILLVACSQDGQLREHTDFLLERCAALRCSLHTLALASEEDMDALPELSMRARTPFTFIEEASFLREALQSLVDRLSTTVAQQVEVTLKPCFHLEEVLTPFDCYRKPGGSWHVRIPDLGVGERRDILVKLAVPAAAQMKQDGSITLLEASVSSQGGYSLAESTSISMRRTTEEGGAGGCIVNSVKDVRENLEVRDQVERWEAGRVLEEAVFDADHLAFEAAVAHVRCKRGEYELMERTPLLALLDQDLCRMEQSFELRTSTEWKACRPKVLQALLGHRLQRLVNIAAPTSH